MVKAHAQSTPVGAHYVRGLLELSSCFGCGQGGIPLVCVTDPCACAQSLVDEISKPLELQIQQLQSDLKRLWHFAGCPFDHCQQCIDDANWIKSLNERLGSPSAQAVMAQREAR